MKADDLIGQPTEFKSDSTLDREVIDYKMLWSLQTNFTISPRIWQHYAT